MIFTYSDYISSLEHELFKRPKRVWIATYNFNVGIAGSGNVFSRSLTFQLFTRIANTTIGSRILVGVPPSVPRELARKLTHSAEYFSQLQWRSRSDQHLKCWIFFHQDNTRRALVGGRNVGDSDWADVSIWVGNGDARRLVSFYDDLWIKAKQVNVSKGLVLK